MQIVFPGPDGQLLTVSDVRPDPVPNKPAKTVTFALPQERRPTGWLVSAFRV